MSGQFITPKKRPLSELDSNGLLRTFEDPQDMINAVISTLLAPEEKTNVSIAYANDKNQATEIQAYAKIAGKDWTFYVKSLAVSIGRNTELSAPSNTNITTPLIDIDLGPAKVVSRLHAAITYNLDLRCWELKVLGRNGARIDGQKVSVDSPNVNALHSGAILDIGGTQMMFILPDAPAVVAPKMLEKCLLKYKEQQQNQNKRISSGPGVGGSTSFQMFDKAHLTHSPSSISANSLQSNLDQDLSKEEAKDIKPPYSYATMITQAILSNPQGVMSLSEIYNWIADHYAYYKYSKTGWQNSIRHNLSLNKAFEKVPRRPNEPGKGMKWQISESYKEEFLNKISDGTILKTRRGSSVSRQLSLHLATHNHLPESHKYTMDQQIHNGPAAPIPQQQQQQQQQQKRPPPQQQNSQPHYPIPPNPMQNNTMGYITQSNIYNMPNNDRRYTPFQQQPNPLMYQQQQQQQQQQHIGQTYNQLGRPLGQLGQPMMQPQPQGYTLSNIKPEQNSLKRNPSISNNSPKLAKGTVSTESHSRSASYTTTQLHETSNFSSSANDSTSTAPTASTTTNGDIGLNFASPKKITALEAYTPERGSKGNSASTNNNNNNTNNNGKNITGGPNTNQSSPAFWNFVQFSTPNGQSPVRKSSEEVGNTSPTLNRKMKHDRTNDETTSPFKKDQRTEMIDL